ncbi:hypothetical protein M5E88_10830 [Akkermansia muciniphila]|nr:hypothetical protein M5E88_10830 [Akkermansia muciniphila]
MRLADRLSTPGCSAYEMTITPQNDPIPENNRAVSFLEVTGGNGVLLLSGYDRDPWRLSWKRRGSASNNRPA